MPGGCRLAGTLRDCAAGSSLGAEPDWNLGAAGWPIAAQNRAMRAARSTTATTAGPIPARSITVIDVNTLRVSGYVGFSFPGRTRPWKRIEVKQ